LRRRLLAATVLMHLPFALAVHHLLAARPRGWVVAAVLSVTLVGAFVGRLELLFHDRRISRTRRIVEEAYFVHWSALLFLLVPWALVIATRSVLSVLNSGALPALEPIGADAVVGYAVAFALACYGVLLRRRWVRVRMLDVEIAGLHAELDGYRIVQLSDLHVGSLCPKERASKWVARSNALEPDLTVLTGDYVTSGTAFHHDIAAAVGELRARDGVFAVMGNHDYYGDGEPLSSLLRQRGVTLLNNARTTLRRDGGMIELAGVDDTFTQRCDIDATFAGFEGGRPLIVLAHDPRLFPKLALRGADLVLSGHTHWGQIGVPFAARALNYARTVYRHHAGFYREGAATLYVNPGLGTTGPPVRLGTWPEISLFRLRRAS